MKKTIFVSMLILVIACFSNQSKAQVYGGGGLTLDMFMPSNGSSTGFGIHLMGEKAIGDNMGVNLTFRYLFHESETNMWHLMGYYKYYLAAKDQIKPYVGGGLGLANWSYSYSGWVGSFSYSETSLAIAPTGGFIYKINQKTGLNVGATYHIFLEDGWGGALTFDAGIAISF